MSDFDDTFLGERVTLDRGGLLISTFSCVLLAELAVGRIILARKLSSTGLEAVLERECGRSFGDCPGGERDAACLRTLDAVGVIARWRVVLFKLDGLRDRVEVAPDFAADVWEEPVEFATRAGLAADDDRTSLLRAAGFVASRAGGEARVGLVDALFVVASDVRLVL